MKISKRAKGIIGIAAILVVVAIAILWNTVLFTAMSSQTVYVLKKNVVAGDKITVDNIITKRISQTDLLPGAIIRVEDARALLLLESRQFIPAGAQLLKEYFEQPELVLKEGQFIFPVPNEWIITMPDTIRRKDTAYFYAYSTEEAQRLMSKASNSAAQNTVAGSSTPSIELSSPLPAATSSPIATTSTPAPSATSSPSLSNDSLTSLVEGKQYEISATVAYCKDKSNKEVVNSGKDTGDRLERFTGSATISHMEIVATQEQIDLMQKAVLQGYKFIVIYN